MASDSSSRSPDADFLRAVELQQSGRLGEAAALYRALLAVYPANPMLLNNLGAVELQFGNTDAGIGLLQQTLRLAPEQPLALFNLANGFQDSNRLAEALDSYDRAIALKPDYAASFYKRGMVLERLQRGEPAIESYRRAVVLRPDHVEAHTRLSFTLFDQGRAEEALASADRAIALQPGHVDAHVFRAGALMGLRRFDDALASFDRAIALKPGSAEVYRGVALQDVRRFDEALASFNEAIRLAPEDADAHWSKASLLLLIGDYAQGWRLQEWRWKTRSFEGFSRGFSQPLWLGNEPVAGKTLLLHAEGGLGDVIQKSRYVPMAHASGAKVILEVPPSLARLMGSLQELAAVVPRGSPLPGFDFHCPTMSLPLAFNTTLATVPDGGGYLHVDAEKKREWQQRLGGKTRPRVGLAWSGLVRRAIDLNPAKKRDIPLRLLAPLLSLPLEFHSLQKVVRPEDAEVLAGFSQIRQHQDELADFSDTAALIEELDLVVTIDTSVAHLAGALGKPVWIALPYATDYRWTAEGTRTPWYHTATLFRQATIGDWSGVIADIVRGLQTTLVPG